MINELFVIGGYDATIPSANGWKRIE